MGHATYLIFELAWGLPVLLLQWAVGHAALSRSWRTGLVAILVPTIYLSLTDAVAISEGIWTLHADRIIGIRVGVVPVEEAIFFLLTNAMVVQSVILVRAYPQLRSHFQRKSTSNKGPSRDYTNV